MNKTVNIPSIQKIMVNFQVENERAEMTQEVMGDMLDDAMAEDGDSDEEEKIVGAVLDEIGISFGDTIPDAPDAMAARPDTIIMTMTKTVKFILTATRIHSTRHTLLHLRTSSTIISSPPCQLPQPYYNLVSLYAYVGESVGFRARMGC